MAGQKMRVLDTCTGSWKSIWAPKFNLYRCKYLLIWLFHILNIIIQVKKMVFFTVFFMVTDNSTFAEVFPKASALTTKPCLDVMGNGCLNGKIRGNCSGKLFSCMRIYKSTKPCSCPTLKVPAMHANPPFKKVGLH